jgi:thiol-disulfide isomerase/thioredoxin
MITRLLLTLALIAQTPALSFEDRLSALRKDSSTAAEGGLDAAEFADLRRRGLELEAAATGPREVAQALRFVLRLGQGTGGPDGEALRRLAVDHLLARRLDAGTLDEEAWKALLEFVDTLRRPDLPSRDATREELDGFHEDARRVEDGAASDRLRATARFVAIENRLAVDRLHGPLADGERRATLTSGREGLRRFGQEQLVDGRTYLEAIGNTLRELETLHVGARAPEIDGVDLDLAPLKLSSFRGKVVVLSFWASWCPPCMDAVPHEKALLAKFARWPVALVGVNGDDDRAAAHAAVARTGITWPSFWAHWTGENGRDEPLKDTWYVRFWPIYYVVDQKGVIRHKSAWDEDLGKIEAIVTELLGSIADF